MVCFALERYPLAFACAAWDVKLENVLRLDDLVALTFLAPLLLGDDLAGPLTVAARDGLLGDKTRADLAEDCLEAEVKLDARCEELPVPFEPALLPPGESDALPVTSSCLSTQTLAGTVALLGTTESWEPVGYSGALSRGSEA